MNSAKNILILIAFLFATSLAVLCCDDTDDDGQHKHSNCKGCPLSVMLTDNDVNLGSFFAGSRNSLPSPTGSGNILEFTLMGDVKDFYNFSFNMELTTNLGSGTATITQYTWEKADKDSQCIYKSPEVNKIGGYYLFQLFKNKGVGHCKAFAKFRLTAREIFITPDAQPGTVKFSVTVVATANI